MNKIYPTLYSRDTTGKIRTWFMEQSRNKYRTTSGVFGSDNMVTSEWSVAEEKNVGRANETTSTEQATSEVDAKYVKQLKTGYHKNIDDVDVFQYVEPMLAKKYKDYIDKIDFTKKTTLLQCKFNGHRCVITRHGAFTRKGERYFSTVHIEKSLVKFFEKFPDAVLDGELFNYELRTKLNEISKLITRKVDITPEYLAKSEAMIKFYCYDGYNFGGFSQEDKYVLRKKWIDENLVAKNKYIALVEDIEIYSKKQFDVEYNKLLNDEQEGGILRFKDMPYENKRSKWLLKVKSEDDSEAIILSILDGDGNWSGAATTANIKWNDIVFEATFKGNYATRAEILKNQKDWIGKEVTFLYMGLTGKGTPNSARIDPANCFKS